MLLIYVSYPTSKYVTKVEIFSVSATYAFIGGNVDEGRDSTFR